MRQCQNLFVGGKYHTVLSNDAAASQYGKPDFTKRSLANNTIAPAPFDGSKRNASTTGRCFA